MKKNPPKTKTILIMDGDRGHDWIGLFKNRKLKDGSELEIVCCSWMDIEVCVYPNDCAVKCRPISSSIGVGEKKEPILKPKSIVISPDFIIVRNQPRGPTPDCDRRNQLFGLMNAGIPSINSLESIYMNLERPIVNAALKKIQKRVGAESFPLIPMTFYSSSKEMVISPSFPSIIKIWHAHAGMGKIRVGDYNQFQDVSTIVALNNLYCQAEPFITVSCGIRVQKIGSSYRVYKKLMSGSNWKSHFGGSRLIMEPLTDEYKLWADECSKLFGGMDMLAVDAVVDGTGKKFVIELNGSPIGLLSEYWKEDSEKIVNLAIQRMNKLFCEKREKE